MAQSEDVLTNLSPEQQMELHQYNFQRKEAKERGLPSPRKPQFMLPFTAEEQAQQAALWQHYAEMQQQPRRRSPSRSPSPRNSPRNSPPRNSNSNANNSARAPSPSRPVFQLETVW